MIEPHEKPAEGGVRINGTVVTAVMALLAFTVQWGMVTTKLDHLDSRLTELLVESRAAGDRDAAFERRLSTLEGRLDALNRASE